VRREPVVVNGAPVICEVIEAVYPAPQSMGADSSTQAYTTYWIDPSSALVLRDSLFIRIENTTSGKPLEMVQTSRYPSVSVGKPIPDSMWVFTPPPGAREVGDLRDTQPERPNLTGQQAAPFSLADLAGKTRTLASYRGKVVLLDFWATWCGPCRVTMPHVQKFHRELRSKGLVVLGINIGETAAKVRPFLAKNGYDFQVLLDPKHAVAERYQANAIPTTVIIDRKGKIVAYFTGVKSEEELRAGLKKAGL
jgi:peroxiredoxin